MSALSIEQIRKEFEKMPEAPWVTEMKRHFAKHGFYRATDLRRLIGDPRKGVKVRPLGEKQPFP